MLWRPTSRILELKKSFRALMNNWRTLFRHWLNYLRSLSSRGYLILVGKRLYSKNCLLNNTYMLKGTWNRAILVGCWLNENTPAPDVTRCWPDVPATWDVRGRTINPRTNVLESHEIYIHAVANLSDDIQSLVSSTDVYLSRRMKYLSS